MHNKESNLLECSHSPSALHPTSTNIYIVVWIFCWAFFATFKKNGGLLMEKQQLLFTAPRVVVYSKELELTGAQIQWESPEKGWPKHTWNHWKEWSIHLKSCFKSWILLENSWIFVCSKEPWDFLRPTRIHPTRIPKLPPRCSWRTTKVWFASSQSETPESTCNRSPRLTIFATEKKNMKIWAMARINGLVITYKWCILGP